MYVLVATIEHSDHVERGRAHVERGGVGPALAGVAMPPGFSVRLGVAHLVPLAAPPPTP